MINEYIDNKEHTKKRAFIARCAKCFCDLSRREQYLCFVCQRIKNDKLGLVTSDTIEYDP